MELVGDSTKCKAGIINRNIFRVGIVGVVELEGIVRLLEILQNITIVIIIAMGMEV
jgi:hypothetical protein